MPTNGSLLVNAHCAGASVCAQQPPSRGLKKMGKGLSRSAPDERVDEPGEDRGHISAKRNGFHLHVDSAVLFF
jgi:hypothetical protein